LALKKHVPCFKIAGLILKALLRATEALSNEV
jgi:hypothetical protein